MLRRFDGILRDFAELFSESLNPNRLNPNQFADVLRNFADLCGILRIFAEFCGFVYGILRNFAESLNPNRLNPNRLTADLECQVCAHRVQVIGPCSDALGRSVGGFCPEAKRCLEEAKCSEMQAETKGYAQKGIRVSVTNW